MTRAQSGLDPHADEAPGAEVDGGAAVGRVERPKGDGDLLAGAQLAEVEMLAEHGDRAMRLRPVDAGAVEHLGEGIALAEGVADIDLGIETAERRLGGHRLAERLQRRRRRRVAEGYRRQRDRLAELDAVGRQQWVDDGEGERDHARRCRACGESSPSEHVVPPLLTAWTPSLPGSRARAWRGAAVFVRLSAQARICRRRCPPACSAVKAILSIESTESRMWQATFNRLRTTSR